jgi:hypothetical protein
MFSLCALFKPAYSETDGTVLLLQQTPVQGGTVTPDIGVHHFGLNTDVTLTAVPKPGFQFVYWLGDVSDPIANRTVVYLDAPKIVIAIFERVEHEFLDVKESVQSSPGGGLLASAPDYVRQGYSGSGSRKPEQPSPPKGKPKDDDFPVPIPEPATVCLLALGGLCLLRRKRKRYIFGGKQK